MTIRPELIERLRDKRKSITEHIPSEKLEIAHSKGMLSARERIATLFERMWIHLGTAAGLLLLILSVVFFVARQIALAAGLPSSVPGMSLDRQCASGLMGIATAAKQVVFDQQKMAVGGGLESISLVQNQHMNLYRGKDEALLFIRGEKIRMLRGDIVGQLLEEIHKM